PQPDPPATVRSSGVVPMAVTIGESEAEKERRVAIYVLGAGLVMVFVVAGSGVAVRDWRSKRVGGARRAGR
ncbi:type VII secretion-associated serine protease mycosin, partial [Streptomyces spongiae]|nr:type VII secretion-associated serine protease mycosin [Streptomyces spongiae]